MADDNDVRSYLHRRDMDLVRWKVRAQRSQQLVVIAAILLGLTVVIGLLFALLLTGTFSNDAAAEDSSGITRDIFGVAPSGQKIERFTFRNKRGTEMQVISLGCAMTSLKVADREGVLADVVLGFDNIEGYGGGDNPYFGSVIGRVANRINRGIFTLDGALVYVKTNEFKNTLHGGPRGWDKVIWMATQGPDLVTFSHISPDGDQGFPGEVHVNVTFQLTEEDEISVRFSAEVLGKATPINLSFHPYFNLAGEGAGNIFDHLLVVYADKYLPVSDEMIPVDDFAEVTGTQFDFRKQTRLGDRLSNFTKITSSEMPPELGGYDHSFYLKGPTGKRLAARLTHPGTGRVMEVFTDQPALHVYTGNALNVSSGKQNHYYLKHHGIALETQNFPDAVNHPNFPDSVLRPGSTYWHAAWYKFSTLRATDDY